MKSVKSIFLFTLLLCSGILQAGDGLVVIASSTKTFTPGAIIAADQVIELEQNQQLRLITASGGVVNLVGPYRGRIAAQTDAQDDGVLSALARVVKAAHSSDMTLAAFRNDNLGQTKKRADIWGVDLSQPGTYCLRGDQPALLWWADAVKGANIEIENLDASQTASFRWKKRGKSVAWPDALSLADGNRYRAGNDLSDARIEFTVALMPQDFANDAARLAWMSDRGCGLQSMRLLGDLVAREN